jgi:hypothetical protein
MPPQPAGQQMVKIRRGGLPGLARKVWQLLTGQESIVVPIYKQTAGEFPPVTFPDLRDYYTKDPDAYGAVNWITNRSLSKGYHIECNGDAPNYLRTEAESFLETWLKEVRWGDKRNERGFETMARTIMQEMCWGGTSLVEMIDPLKIEALAQVELSSIWRYQRDNYGNLRWIWQYPFVNPAPLHPERYIMYVWNQVDRNPFGYGLLHSIAQWKTGPNGSLIPPDILSKWQITDDIRRRLHRYGSPRSIFGLPGLTEAEAKQIAEAVKDPEADVSFATNTQVEVSMDTPTGRANFAPDLQYFQDRINLGLSNPMSQWLAGSKGFSYNSAQEFATLGDMIIWDLQSRFKSITELELLHRVLEQNGFDPSFLKPEFTYNIPDEPEDYSIADVLTAATPDKVTGKSIITAQEAREILRKFAHWDLIEDPAQTNSPGNLVSPVNQPAPSQANQSAGVPPSRNAVQERGHRNGDRRGGNRGRQRQKVARRNVGG